MFQEVCSRLWKVFSQLLMQFLKVGIILEVKRHIHESSQRVLSKALRTGNFWTVCSELVHNRVIFSS
jgi:hypothetical protein